MDGRSHSQSASFEDVKQMLIRLIGIELRFLNRQALVLVTTPTELPWIPKQYNTTFILAILTVSTVAPYITDWSRSLLDTKETAFSKHFKLPKYLQERHFNVNCGASTKCLRGFKSTCTLRWLVVNVVSLWQCGHPWWQSICTHTTRYAIPNNVLCLSVCLSVNYNWNTVRERDSLKNRHVLTRCVNQPISVAASLSRCDIPHTPRSFC